MAKKGKKGEDAVVERQSREWYIAQMEALQERLNNSDSLGEHLTIIGEVSALRARWEAEYPGAYSPLSDEEFAAALEAKSTDEPSIDITKDMRRIIDLSNSTVAEFIVLGGDYPVALRHGIVWGGATPTLDDADRESIETHVAIVYLCPHCQEIHRPTFAWDGKMARMIESGGVRKAGYLPDLNGQAEAIAQFIAALPRK